MFKQVVILMVDQEVVIMELNNNSKFNNMMIEQSALIATESLQKLQHRDIFLTVLINKKK